MITIQRTDQGIQFIILVQDEQTKQPINLSGITGVNFIFMQADKSVLIKSGTLYTDGTDGKVQYTTQSGELLIAGITKLQIMYTLSSNNKYTNYITFQIVPNLTDYT